VSKANGGFISGDFINSILDLIPKANITVPSDVKISYAENKRLKSGIHGHKIYGMFDSEVIGLDDRNIPEKYL
jgi:hypothetical protein